MISAKRISRETWYVPARLCFWVLQLKEVVREADGPEQDESGRDDPDNRSSGRPEQGDDIAHQYDETPIVECPSGFVPLRHVFAHWP
jgi:hypothetical protein